MEKKSVPERLSAIETDVKWIREKLSDANCKSHLDRLTKIEKTLSWRMRFALSTLVMVIIGIVGAVIKLNPLK